MTFLSIKGCSLAAIPPLDGKAGGVSAASAEALMEVQSVAERHHTHGQKMVMQSQYYLCCIARHFPLRLCSNTYGTTTPPILAKSCVDCQGLVSSPLLARLAVSNPRNLFVKQLGRSRQVTVGGAITAHNTLGKSDFASGQIRFVTPACCLNPNRSLIRSAAESDGTASGVTAAAHCRQVLRQGLQLIEAQRPFEDQHLGNAGRGTGQRDRPEPSAAANIGTVPWERSSWPSAQTCHSAEQICCIAQVCELS